MVSTPAWLNSNNLARFETEHCLRLILRDRAEAFVCIKNGRAPKSKTGALDGRTIPEIQSPTRLAGENLDKPEPVLVGYRFGAAYPC